MRWRSSDPRFDAVTPVGNPSLGRPLGTGPSIATPLEERSRAKLSAMEPTTAIRAPGIFLLMKPDPTMTTSTPTDTRSVSRLVWPRFDSALTNLATVLPPVSGTPNMPPICPMATWMPTPVRKPTRTVLERKSARKPRRTRRATIRMAPVIRASTPAYAMYSDEPTATIPTRPAAMMAAVAESAPTTKWRDEPNRAKSARGRINV